MIIAYSLIRLIKFDNINQWLHKAAFTVMEIWIQIIILWFLYLATSISVLEWPMLARIAPVFIFSMSEIKNKFSNPL